MKSGYRAPVRWQHRTMVALAMAALAFLPALAPNADAAVAPRSDVAQTRTVLVMGDSLSAAYGLSASQGWAETVTASTVPAQRRLGGVLVDHGWLTLEQLGELLDAQATGRKTRQPGSQPDRFIDRSDSHFLQAPAILRVHHYDQVGPVNILFPDKPRTMLREVEIVLRGESLVTIGTRPPLLLVKSG